MGSGVAIENKARVPKRWRLEMLLDGETGTADQYQGHTSSIEWPSNQTAYTWKGGDDNTITDIADGDQVCNITVAQDLTEGSLWRIMRENPGKRAVLTYWPEYGGTYAERATITLLRPPLLTNKGGQLIEHQVSVPSTVPVPFTDAEPDPEP